jgi:RNA polymerase sigma-70 factor (ECF subfamily)
MAVDTQAALFEQFYAMHAALVARLHQEAGAERWGVTLKEFAAALCRSASHHFGGEVPGAGALGPYLSALHLEDLALCCALRNGSEPAWEHFINRHRAALYSSARAIAGSLGEARSRELADSLYAELYGIEGAGGARSRPLLDYFHGRSKLSTWLRTVLAQRHVDSLRAARRTDSLDEKHILAEPQASVEGHDPDRARLLPRLRQAFSGALASLPPTDRLLLSLYYLQEMTLAQIAKLRGIHEASASRHLDRIRGELRKKVEHSLRAGLAATNGSAAQPGLSPAEVELCFRYVLEDWSFDLGSELSSRAQAESRP